MKARHAALKILRRVERENAYANRALASELERSGLDPRDKALVTEIVYGVLRRQRTLDYWIHWLTDGKRRKIDAPVRDVLRLSLYQQLYLEKIPEHAILSEAGQVLRRVGFPHAVGFVNAVLRRCQREIRADNQPPWPEDSLEKLAVTEGLPRWILDEWSARDRLKIVDSSPLKRFARLQDRARACNGASGVALYPNPQRTTVTELVERIEELGGKAEAGIAAHEALRLGAGGQGVLEALAAEGLAHVMDEAAQLVMALPEIGPSDSLLDLCAAPGGKSLFALGKLAGGGSLVSVDIHAKKLKLLERQVEAFGFERHEAFAADATQPIEALEGKVFDGVILDAPCSALGLLRRQPEIRHRRKPEDVVKLSQVQRKLLARGVDYLRSGGWLLFSVCTDTLAEGPEQIAWLTEKFGGETLPLTTVADTLVFHTPNGDLFDSGGHPLLDGFQAFVWRKP